jgi:2-methylisocitrate lyase-like PEP mutase family enzyme
MLDRAIDGLKSDEAKALREFSDPTSLLLALRSRNCWALANVVLNSSDSVASAAVDARRDADILILARTDARAVHGFDEALDRCRDFETEGADIIFLEAPENELEMRRFCEAMRKPCMANMVPGGKTPILPPKELQGIGYKLALYPVVLMSAAIAAMQAALVALRPESKKAFPPSVLFAELQQVVGFPEYWERETRYKASD